MKYILFCLTVLASSTTFASTFTVKTSETKYYYAGMASEAAEAKMWKSALNICQKSSSTTLPIRVSEIAFIKERAFVESASAQFICLDPEGREF